MGDFRSRLRISDWIEDALCLVTKKSCEVCIQYFCEDFSVLQANNLSLHEFFFCMVLSMILATAILNTLVHGGPLGPKSSFSVSC